MVFCYMKGKVCLFGMYRGAVLTGYIDRVARVDVIVGATVGLGCFMLLQSIDTSSEEDRIFIVNQ